jgi:hypothetical protein
MLLESSAVDYSHCTVHTSELRVLHFRWSFFRLAEPIMHRQGHSLQWVSGVPEYLVDSGTACTCRLVNLRTYANKKEVLLDLRTHGHSIVPMTAETWHVTPLRWQKFRHASTISTTRYDMPNSRLDVRPTPDSWTTFVRANTAWNTNNRQAVSYPKTRLKRKTQARII